MDILAPHSTRQAYISSCQGDSANGRTVAPLNLGRGEPTMTNNNALAKLNDYAAKYINARSARRELGYKAKFLELRSMVAAVCPDANFYEIEDAYAKLYGNPRKTCPGAPFSKDARNAVYSVLKQIDATPKSAFELYMRDCDELNVPIYERLDSNSTSFRKVREFLSDAAHDGVIKETRIMNNGRLAIRLYSI